MEAEGDNEEAVTACHLAGLTGAGLRDRSAELYSCIYTQMQPTCRPLPVWINSRLFFDSRLPSHLMQVAQAAEIAESQVVVSFYAKP